MRQMSRLNSLAKLIFSEENIMFSFWSFAIGVVSSIWVFLFIFMLLQEHGHKILVRKNLPWLFVITFGFGLIAFLMLFFPAVQVIIKSLKWWVWLIGGISIVGLAILIPIWIHHHNKNK